MILFDNRGNEFGGAIDQITNGLVTDARAFSANLASVNGEAVMDLNGHAVALFHLQAGAVVTATMVFEATVDGTNYFTVPAMDVVTEAMVGAVALAAATITRVFAVGVTGFRRVRVRMSAWTSGTVTVAARATLADFSIYAKPIPANLHVTATAAINTASTCTLPAGPAGTFHYVTKVSLQKLYGVIGVAAGAGVIITSTNLPGTPAWTTEQLASAAGAVARVIDEDFSPPLKSSVAATATTFVAPLQLQTIWRWNVSYYIGS